MKWKMFLRGQNTLIEQEFIQKGKFYLTSSRIEICNLIEWFVFCAPAFAGFHLEREEAWAAEITLHYK